MNAMKVFELSDTHGLPFEMIGMELAERGLVPDWEDYMRQAIAHLWTPEHIWRAAEESARPLGFWTDPEFHNPLRMMFVVEMSQK